MIAVALASMGRWWCRQIHPVTYTGGRTQTCTRCFTVHSVPWAGTPECLYAKPEKGLVRQLQITGEDQTTWLVFCEESSATDDPAGEWAKFFVKCPKQPDQNGERWITSCNGTRYQMFLTQKEAGW